MVWLKHTRSVKKFWKDISHCFKCLGKGRSVLIVLEDVNGKVGSIEAEVGKRTVDAVNENGQYFVTVCAERGLFMPNTFQNFDP